MFGKRTENPRTKNIRAKKEQRNLEISTKVNIVTMYFAQRQFKGHRPVRMERKQVKQRFHDVFMFSFVYFVWL